MTTRMDDQSVAQRVLDHIANRTTDIGQSVWREPVANYRSEARLAAEIEQVLKRSPTPFCPSAALPEAGSFVAREAAGTPLVVVRGADGEVRAFRNACRHRGMQVASGSGCSKAFVCRYHGWTYNLEGRLRHIPHEEGFPGFDKEAHPLVPVTAREHLGLVFVTQNESMPGDESLDGLGRLIGPDQRVFATVERDFEVNWKILLESFIEGYHIKSTHPESFLPYGFDNLNVIDLFGRNSRVTYPFQRIKKLAKVPPHERRVEGLLTYVYQLFPNVLITVLSRHTNVVILEPLAIDRTRQITYTLTNGGGDDPAALAEAKRDAEFVGTTGAAEDRAVVQAIQRGLGSGANKAFTFGKFESAIVHFHQTLTAALERS
ncbi:MAG: SRPBCC family protein [Reyranella sp.]|uniref:aromatic ring-hydroxylating oxygenase subunit alpha n=1 Tax=Reyranella sp. TaxID=1929291 RepID=UPI00273012B2|nr:SRPBCC family protein [Reyranella sp.]MDP1964421.1 SRPBCC family protein [Reyranella sp.]MDP2373531.1 SRPBCC family protein [Reyranella sp.]